MKQRKVRVMAKSKDNIQETETKVKSRPKKSKVKDEPLEPKVEPLDNVKVDVEQSLIAASELTEIDLRNYNHSDVVGGYIRRKRSI